jgi:threonylcarbamoyladenosine tRNA methylthiotransferase MtaB
MTRRRNPRALIIATGCYAQRSHQELAQLADLVVDNTVKQHLLAIIQALSLEERVLDEGEAKQSQVLAATVRTRSLIKIQDGCHGPCTYCIVPKVRPREYSLPASQIIDEVKQKVALAYKEVVLTGTKVGSYKDAVLSASEGSSTNLKDLVQRILRDTGIERLRLSSLQPSEISSEFLALWQDERLCRHFHLALQSGSETVLQRMRRSYSLDQYQRTINLIKEMIPEVAITTDIMVGFPGESDEEFEQSYSFCQQAGFANIHVFPFSPRLETAAAKMPKQIKDKVKQERNQRILELSRSSRRRFCEQFLGQTMPVLWEEETSPGSGIYSGLTSNYIRVFAHSEKSLSNEITPVKLVGFHNQGIWGEIVDENPG